MSSEPIIARKSNSIAALEEECSALREQNHALISKLNSLNAKMNVTSKYVEFLERLVLKAMKQM